MVHELRDHRGAPLRLARPSGAVGIGVRGRREVGSDKRLANRLNYHIYLKLMLVER